MVEAVIHFNRAAQESAEGRPNVEIARTLFQGIERMQNGWRLTQMLDNLGIEAELRRVVRSYIAQGETVELDEVACGAVVPLLRWRRAR